MLSTFAAGLPVVATAAGALSEQATAGPDAALAAAVTLEALADAMEQVMNPAMHRALPFGAAASGRKSGDWDPQAVELLEGLRHVGLD